MMLFKINGERWLCGRAPDCLLVQSHLPLLKLIQFHSPHICLCLSEETLKAGGPFKFYLVSMPGEVKDPAQGVNV